MRFKIDPEFEKMIPSLTRDEFRQLEENILEEGIVLMPIIVWNNYNYRWPYYEDEDYRPQINQLAQEGIDFLSQVRDGNVPENPYATKQVGA